MDHNELLTHSCYKTLLKQKQKQVVRRHPKLTWKFLSEKVRVQHTYVSRSFNRDNVHLSEDHLFEMMDLLEFDAFERDYTLLLRDRALAVSPGRRAYVERRLKEFKDDYVVRVDARKKEATPEQMEFLMNPLLLLLFVSLHVKRYANAPAQLGAVYGLTPAQLEKSLRQLDQMGMIRYDAKTKSVPEVKRSRMHFPREHPLMNGSQQILRHLSAARIARVEEAERVNFMASFSASAGAFDKIREEFNKFLGEVQKIAGNGEGERVYQLSFDLFPWD